MKCLFRFICTVPFKWSSNTLVVENSHNLSFVEPLITSMSISYLSIVVYDFSCSIQYCSITWYHNFKIQKSGNCCLCCRHFTPVRWTSNLARFGYSWVSNNILDHNTNRNGWHLANRSAATNTIIARCLHIWSSVLCKSSIDCRYVFPVRAGSTDG